MERFKEWVWETFWRSSSSRNRGLTLQGEDIEASASVSDMR